MTLDELIKERIKRIESVPDKLITAIDKQNDKTFKAMLSQLAKLEQRDGSIIASKENFAAIAGIIEKLKGVFVDAEYVDAIKSFATEIRKQSLINNSILAATVSSFNDDELFKQVVKNAQKNALLLLDENAVANRFMQPLSDLLTTSVSTGVSFTDAVKNLQASIVGDNSIYSKYSTTLVKDAFAIADAQYVQLTSKAHGIEFNRYSGGEVADSRKFCVERHDQIFHVKEIEAWGRFENTDPAKFDRPADSPVYITNQGVKIYWEGQNYNTNSATIFSYRGGYTCNHQLVPIATEYVPADVIARATALGFYVAS